MTNSQPATPSTAQPTPPSRSQLLLQTLRAVMHALVVLTITTFGFMAWPLPWPGIAYGLSALVLGVLLWALFLSPKPVLRTDRFGQALIELLFIGGAVAALIVLGVAWPFAAAFGVIAAGLGYAASR